MSGTGSVRGRRRGGHMHVEDLLDHLPGSGPRKTAFGGNAEIADVLAGHLDAPTRSLQTVLGVNQPKIKFGAARKFQSQQRAIEIIVGLRDRNRNMEIS